MSTSKAQPKNLDAWLKELDGVRLPVSSDNHRRAVSALRNSNSSLREIAEGLFGSTGVASDWHADSALRARVRRLVQRGRSLVDGGYRALAGLDQLASPPQGRNSPTSNRP